MATTRARGARHLRGLPTAPAPIVEESVVEVLDIHEDSPELVGMPDEEMRAEMIRTAAYYIAEARDFEPGHEIEDWLAAERAVDETLARR